MLRECLELRQAYVYKEEVAPWNQPLDATESGKNHDPFCFCPVEKTDLMPFPSAYDDIHLNPKTMQKFRLYLLVNADREFLAQKGAPHRDFYNIRKVDTHIHHSTCMNQKHLLRFIKSKLRKEPDEMAEYRISIYGRKQSEWDQLASWFINNEIYSENAVWLIQVVGFDLVDDESKPERRPTKRMPTPAEWTNEFNPAYSYYTYYCYANLFTLNKADDIDHLAAGFLLCHNILHGINLRKAPVLSCSGLPFSFCPFHIGLAMSPLSNNQLFLDYHRNPLPVFFQKGLNVSLSSDDRSQIHLTKEALVEEYSVAAQVWKLSSCDLCEIASNSVYQSGFSHAAELHWLGNKYFFRGPAGNDIHKTNVPNLRISIRHETWKEEMQYVYSGKARVPEEIDI
ncbi:hypothetical protein Cgig2_031233 [Carnegiea gigantea]|uniref:AMP deaminase n=1 Tax=Carnegiea gigantea TaxID=171969 RepID=A0A9Q1KM13_9CARY|nr:hypothetical protein Cgig2_031233 [Carnegiea gigantea]